jgi:hypothetical protein
MARALDPQTLEVLLICPALREAIGSEKVMGLCLLQPLFKVPSPAALVWVLKVPKAS